MLKERVLGSRALHVNKLAGVGDWKAFARWITGGHNDPDKGYFANSSPTALLLCHQMVLFYASMMGWICSCADVRSAFLQGGDLEGPEPLFLRIILTWPQKERDHLWDCFGQNCRRDILYIRKGVFGLQESPRLFCKHLKKWLGSIGSRKLVLVRCCFVLFKSVVCIEICAIHVDDLLFAGSATGCEVFERLKTLL